MTTSFASSRRSTGTVIAPGTGGAVRAAASPGETRRWLATRPVVRLTTATRAMTQIVRADPDMRARRETGAGAAGSSAGSGPAALSGSMRFVRSVTVRHE